MLGDVRPHAPEGLALEGGDQLVLLHAEVEGGGLAGPVAHHRGVQVPVLALQSGCSPETGSVCTHDCTHGCSRQRQQRVQGQYALSSLADIILPCVLQSNMGWD